MTSTPALNGAIGASDSQYPVPYPESPHYRCPAPAMRRAPAHAPADPESSSCSNPRRTGKRRRAILARSLGYAHDRYQAGYASYLEELDAQRNLYRVELDLVTLQRTQVDNLIALYRALGGGWPAGAGP